MSVEVRMQHIGDDRVHDDDEMTKNLGAAEVGDRHRHNRGEIR